MDGAEDTGLKWLFSNSTANPPASPDDFIAESFYMCAPIYDGDRHYNTMKELLEAGLDSAGMAHKEIRRIRCNLDTRLFYSDAGKHHTIHVDSQDEKEFVFLYYVLDSDGDTILFNKDKKVVDRISPEQGKGLIFPASMPHCGSSPALNPYRFVINFNFTLAE